MTKNTFKRAQRFAALITAIAGFGACGVAPAQQQNNLQGYQTYPSQESQPGQTVSEGSFEETDPVLEVGGPTVGEISGPSNNGSRQENSETETEIPEQNQDTVTGGGAGGLNYITNDDLVSATVAGQMHGLTMADGNAPSVTGTMMGSRVDIVGNTTHQYNDDSMVRMDGAAWSWLQVEESTTYQVNLVNSMNHTVEIGGEMMQVFLCTGPTVGVWNQDTTPGQGGGGGGECEVTPTPGMEDGTQIMNVNCIFNSTNSNEPVEVNFYKAVM